MQQRLPHQGPGDAVRPSGPDLATSLLRTYRRQARFGRLGHPAGAVQPQQRRPRRSPPELLGDVLLADLAQIDRSRLTVQGLAWGKVVGRDIAAHVQPAGFDTETGVLTLACDSEAWAKQVHWLARQLTARLNFEFPGTGILRIEAVRAVADPLETLTIDRTLQAGRPTAPWVGPDHDRADTAARLRTAIGRLAEASTALVRERERLLGVPAGWLDGPENLGPPPAGPIRPDPNRLSTQPGPRAPGGPSPTTAQQPPPSPAGWNSFGPLRSRPAEGPSWRSTSRKDTHG
ncbi:DciA family protein [Kitasatospora sp. NPDC059088]|uniref:DciA family protein n=1 Tax=Kitasatospora sp. NPDC059088 TaxID=3346722 RepID=UPI0036C5E6CE